MKIDWFTIIAQVINFLVLVWLLKRFLYKPVLMAIDERDKKIASQLNDGKTMKDDALKTKEEFQKKSDDLEKQRESVLTKATEDAGVARVKLLEDARKESEALQAKLLENQKAEQERMTREIVHRVEEEVFAISRKVLLDLSSANLEDQITDVFIRRLRESSNDEKQKLITAFNVSDNPVIIHSAFNLSQSQQERIMQVIKEVLSNARVQFEISPNQVSGIELTNNGYGLSWNIRDYLSVLEKKITAQMNGDAKNELSTPKHN